MEAGANKVVKICKEEKGTVSMYVSMCLCVLGVCVCMYVCGRRRSRGGCYILFVFFLSVFILRWADFVWPGPRLRQRSFWPMAHVDGG